MKRRHQQEIDKRLLDILHEELDRRLDDISQFQEVRWPIFVPTRGRATLHRTTRELDAAGLDYRLVIEPQEHATYARHHPAHRLLVLDQNNRGIAYSRNWIKQRALEEGAARHWQIDDDAQAFLLRRDGKPHRISARNALAVVEEVVDNCTNIGSACLSAAAYAFGHDKRAPIKYNGIVYGCILLRSSAPVTFQADVPEDCDATLQVLETGEVTMVFKRVVLQTIATMTTSGGNTETAYLGDGRLERYRRLADAWPGMWKVSRRQDGRPRLVPTSAWRRYTQRPRLRPGASLLSEATGHPQRNGLAGRTRRGRTLPAD